MSRKKFRFDKLVRDGIVESQLKEGSAPDYRVLDDAAFLRALRDKLLEEAGELDTNDKTELVKELADLQEVIDAMLKAVGSSKKVLVEAQKRKKAKVGGFDKRYFISTLLIDESNPWVRYYLQNPDRYPEIMENRG